MIFNFENCQDLIEIDDELVTLLEKVALYTLKERGFSTDVEVDMTIVSGEEIKSLNNEMRNKDSVTDVLSFPQNELEPGNFDPELCERDLDTGSVLLGDMRISIPRCEEQGKELGHGFKREIMYLTVHSVLHLLGYDHVDEGEMKKQMRRREKEIMGDKE